MKVIEKDPRVTLRGTRWLNTEREGVINCQISELMLTMVSDDPGMFVRASLDLNAEIDAKIAEIDAKIAKEKHTVELVSLHVQRQSWEDSRQTPDQLAEKKWQAIKTEAMTVLQKLHDRRMAGRLAQWQTTCRLDGCCKQPYTNSRPTGTGLKSRRRNHLFCHAHLGTKNQIAKADVRRLQANPNLRVVA